MADPETWLISCTVFVDASRAKATAFAEGADELAAAQNLAEVVVFL